MIKFIKEGQKLNYGFNIYHPSDKHNLGFKLKYWKNKVFYLRYAKKFKKLHVMNITASKTDAFMDALR